MGRTSIEWTADDDGTAGMTWNPLRARDIHTGKVGHYCEMISPGCAKCYAAAFQPRFGLPAFSGPGRREERLARLEPFLDERTLLAPLRWRKPRRVFVCSMTDLFLDVYPVDWVARVFAVMALTPQHVHMVLTRRPGRMRRFLGAPNAAEAVGHFAFHLTHEQLMRGDLYDAAPETWPLPNVWLGISAEDQQRAEERIPPLLKTPAAVRFVSAEPLLGPVDLSRYLRLARADLVADAANACARGAFASPDAWALHWVIVGGESGPGARPMDLAWARSLVRQCREASVACFVKQLGARPFEVRQDPTYACEHEEEGSLRLSDPKGGWMGEWPADLRVRQWPDPTARFEVHEDDGEA